MTETTNAQNQDEGKAAARYATGFADREPYLVRARRISRLTIASLYRPWGVTGATDDVIPWQSLCGYCVNNLAAKVVMAMFPPGISPINIKPDQSVVEGMAKMDPDTRGKLKALLDQSLSKEEQSFVENVEEDGDRAIQFDAARHMIVGGNHCLHVCNDATLQSIPLERYVVWRDRTGNMTEFCIEQPMAYASLDPDCQKIARDRGYGPIDADPIDLSKKGAVNWGTNNPLWEPIKVYTHGQLKDGMWWVYDELMSVEVPGSRHPYKPDVLPYLFLRMIALKDEPYGRSYCEDYEADIQTYDAVWQALTEGGAILARAITLIKAGGTTSKDVYSKAPNGAVITGQADEVEVIRSDKGGDLQIIFQEAEKIESRLERMFILNSAVQRSGERVTATEVSFAAQELDTTLGGVYSNQVNSWQRLWAILKITAYRRLGRMTKVPKGTTKITIITGDAALGRQQKAQALEEFLQVMAQIFGPEAIATYVNATNAFQRSAANRAIDTDGLIKSDDQVKQEQMAAKQDALTQQVAPQIAQQGGQMLQNYQQAAIDQQQPPPQGQDPAAAAPSSQPPPPGAQ